MDKLAMTEALVSSKIAKGISWETAATELGMSPVWLTSACLGMNSAPPEKAAAIATYFGFDADMATALQAFPTKIWDQAVPTDPLIYRLYEVVGVLGRMFELVLVAHVPFNLHFLRVCVTLLAPLGYLVQPITATVLRL